MNERPLSYEAQVLWRYCYVKMSLSECYLPQTVSSQAEKNVEKQIKMVLSGILFWNEMFILTHFSEFYVPHKLFAERGNVLGL